MIIVSQDKNEIVNFDKADSVWISSDEEGRHTIEATADTNTTLGYYKTEERAKEILQSIKATYQTSKLFECADNVHQNQIATKYLEIEMTPFLFEMPEE